MAPMQPRLPWQLPPAQQACPSAPQVATQVPGPTFPGGSSQPSPATQLGACRQQRCPEAPHGCMTPPLPAVPGFPSTLPPTPPNPKPPSGGWIGPEPPAAASGFALTRVLLLHESEIRAASTAATVIVRDSVFMGHS